MNKTISDIISSIIISQQIVVDKISALNINDKYLSAKIEQLASSTISGSDLIITGNFKNNEVILTKKSGKKIRISGIQQQGNYLNSQNPSGYGTLTIDNVNALNNIYLNGDQISSLYHIKLEFNKNEDILSYKEGKIHYPGIKLNTGLHEISGINSISTTDINKHQQIVSLKIDNTDRFLTETSAGLKTNISLKRDIDSHEGLFARYYLTDKTGTKVGDYIEIPLPSGGSSSGVMYYAGSGIQKIHGNTFIGKIDDNSQKTKAGSSSYLTVSESGFKIDGIKSDIDAASTYVYSLLSSSSSGSIGSGVIKELSASVTGLVNNISTQLHNYDITTGSFNNDILSLSSINKEINIDINTGLHKVISVSAITTTEIDNHQQKISLNIDQTDLFLSQSDNGLRVDVALAKTATSALPSGVIARYYLSDKNNNQVGSTYIDIPRDKFLSGAAYDPEKKALVLSFYNISGGIDTVVIPLSGLVTTYNAGSGIQLLEESNTFIGKINDTINQQYLTLSQNGFAITGINDTLSALSAYTYEQTLISAKNYTDSVCSGLSSSVTGLLQSISTTLSDRDIITGSFNNGVLTLSTQINNIEISGFALTGNYLEKENPSGTGKFTIDSISATGNISAATIYSNEIDLYRSSISGLSFEEGNNILSLKRYDASDLTVQIKIQGGSGSGIHYLNGVDAISTNVSLLTNTGTIALKLSDNTLKQSQTGLSLNLNATSGISLDGNNLYATIDIDNNTEGYLTLTSAGFAVTGINNALSTLFAYTYEQTLISAKNYTDSICSGLSGSVTGLIDSVSTTLYNRDITSGSFNNGVLTLSTQINNIEISGFALTGNYLTKDNPTGTGTLTIDKLQNGKNCVASDKYTHAEGNDTEANGLYSHVEGDNTTADGTASHAEGFKTNTYSTYSHAEGKQTETNGVAAHAEGCQTIADADYSHAEGRQTNAAGENSHTEGYGTIANYNNQHVAGTFNNPEDKAYIIGGGTYDDRKNIFTVDWNGDVYTSGNISATNINLSGTQLIDDTTNKLNTQFNPVSVASIDDDAGKSNINKVKFIGDCKVTYGANGEIIIRIGQNLNSSNWNTTDGKTNGIVSMTAPTLTNNCYPDLSANTNAKYNKNYLVIKGINNIISIKPAEVIHFDNNTNTYFTTEIFEGKDKTATKYYFGYITGNNSYPAHMDSISGTIKTGLTLEITGFDNETNIQTGANGYKASAEIKFIPSAFLDNNTDFKITTAYHKNGSEGTKEFNNNNYIYYTSGGTEPSIFGEVNFSLSIAPTGSYIKTVSGVKYLKTVDISAAVANISGLATPYAIDQSFYFNDTDANGNDWFNDKISIGKANLLGYTQKISDIVSCNISKNNITLKNGQFNNCRLTATACNGIGQTIKSSTKFYKLLIDNSTINSYNPLQEDFTNQSASRLSSVNPDISFNSQLSLLSGNNDSLQIKNCILQYPNGNYINFNNEVAGCENIIQPDYTNASGIRDYIRKFEKTGDLVTLTFQISGANISSQCTDGSTNLSFWIMNLQEAGAEWKNITAGQPGAMYVDKSSSEFSNNSAKIKVSFNKPATNFVYFKISMNQDCTTKITRVIMAS